MCRITRCARRVGVAWIFAGFLAIVATAASADVRVVESDDRHAVLEIRPAAPEVTEIRTEAGSRYVSLRQVGSSAGNVAGMPDVPMGGFLVAIPPGTTPRLRVVSETWSSSRAGALRPVPERVAVRDPFGADYVQEVEAPEGAAYRAQTEFPREHFAVREIADLRGLRVARIEYAGAVAEIFQRTHRILESATIEVTFERDPGERLPDRPFSVALPERHWERTIEGAVLNAPAARAWRRGGIGDAPSVGNTPYGPGDHWKILIGPTGLVEIPYDALAAQSFPANTPIAQVSFYQRRFDLDAVDDPGTTAAELFDALPVPAVARDRNGNGVFDAGDGFVVYARSFRDQWMTASEYEDLFDGSNYVWARVEPAGGARMTTSRLGGSLSGAAADSLASTPSRWFSERDVRFYEHPPDFVQGRDGFESDFYFWNNDLTSTDPVGDPPIQNGWVADDPFSVADPVPGVAAQLVARILPGGRGLGSSVHAGFTNRVRCSVNGSQVGETVFYNSSKYAGGTGGQPLYVNPAAVLYTYSIPAGNLFAGTNTFTVRGFTYLGNGTSQEYVAARFFFDWYEITYARRLRAASDQLTFTTESGTAGNVLARVEDFTANDVWLFDVTDPEVPTRVDVLPSQIVASGGQFDLRFDHDNAAGVGSYVATRESAVRRAVAGDVTRVPETNAIAGGIGAGYVAVTHPDFTAGAERLATLRSTRYGAHTVTTDALYDLFHNGTRNPDAIRAFSAYAFHRWSTPITFLCLIGDASEDHKRVGLDAAPDLVPSHSLWADWEAAAEDTDQYYAQVTRPTPGAPFDEIPDIYVGRLAVNTPQELDWNVTRIERYEGFESDGVWRRRVVFLADDAFSGSLGANALDGYSYKISESAFENGSESLAVGLEDHPIDAILPERIYMSRWAHPCVDAPPPGGDICYRSYGVDCEALLSRDCGFWYDCRDSTAGWTVEYPCMRLLMYPAVNVAIRQSLDRGAMLWNFQGHANKFFMTHEEVFRDDNRGAPVRRDAEALNNFDKPFILLGWACHLNEFDRFNELATEDCIAEKLMNFQPIGEDVPGGAIASFASSGFEFLSPNVEFNRHVINAFFYPELVTNADLPPESELPGTGAAGYTWALGESTTRARILFWAQETNGNERRAAERFVLLGDPALEPNLGGPEFRVTVNDQAVVNGQFLDVVADDPIRIAATASDARGVQRLRVDDTVRGPVPAEAVTLTTLLETTDGVPQTQQLDYETIARAEDYDLIMRVSDANDRESTFHVSVRADSRIDRAFAYPMPFANKVDIIYTLTSRGTGAHVTVFTVNGRKVWGGIGSASADENRLEWDGRDSSGNPVANGTYIVHLENSAGDRSETRTFPIVKMR